MQVTARAQVLPSLLQLCLLSAFSQREHSLAPQKLLGVPTCTPMPRSPYPNHTYSTLWHPTLSTSSTTLYIPPTPPSAPPPLYLVHLRFQVGVFPQLGHNAAGWELAMLRSRTKRWSKSREVNMGTKEQTLPIAWWGRLQGQETPETGDTRTLAVYPGQEEEALQGALWG